MQPLVQPNALPSATHDLPRRLARASGLLILLLAACGMFSPLVLQTVVVHGDAAATASNVLSSVGLFSSSLVIWCLIVVFDIVVAITLYFLLEPSSRVLSLVAAAFRLVYAAVLGAVLLHLFSAFLLLASPAHAVALGSAQRQAMALTELETFSAGFLLALVLFGTHLLSLGVVLYRSHYVPRPLGVLVVAAGAGYVLDSLASLLVPDYGGPIRVVPLAPALIGELGLMAWLLVKGVNPRPQPATTTAIAARPVAAS